MCIPVQLLSAERHDLKLKRNFHAALWDNSITCIKDLHVLVSLQKHILTKTNLCQMYRIEFPVLQNHSKALQTLAHVGLHWLLWW